MSGHRHNLRGERGRFTVAPGGGTEPARRRDDPVGRRPQILGKHKRALTGRQIDIFLSTLAETCNVSLSAREAKRTARIFYDLKRRDSGFRAAWLEALSAGYDHLEMELLHRARFGTPREVFYQGRKTATTRTFNDGAALRLLQLHRKTVEPMRAADSGGRDAAAIFDELAARMAEIKAEKAAKAREADDGDS